jgi:hypothetical protein
MWIIYDPNDSNRVLGKSGLVYEGAKRLYPREVEALAGYPAGAQAFLVEDDAAAEKLFNAASLVAIVDEGHISGFEAAPADPELWLHGSISGGDVNPMTGTRYLERGETLTYAATLRESQDPGSDPITDIPGTDPAVPISGAWALELVHELGLDQFSPYVTMTAGVISGSVIIPDRLCDGLYQLPEERLAVIDPALLGLTGLPILKLRLADPAAFEFKVRS